MIAVMSHLNDYLYDVFVAKFDFWLAFGLVSQVLFTARFVTQWIASERAKASIVPVSFWVLSIVGGTMLFIYGIQRREPIIIIGQALAILIYVRNLVLIVKNRQTGSRSND